MPPIAHGKTALQLRFTPTLPRPRILPYVCDVANASNGAGRNGYSFDWVKSGSDLFSENPKITLDGKTDLPSVILCPVVRAAAFHYHN